MSYLHTWIGDEPRGSLPCTLAQALAFGVPMSAIEAGEMRGESVSRGAWGITVSFRALCMSGIYVDKARNRWGTEHESETVHGMRTMTQCRESGYQLEGRVTVNGRSYRAFTSSQLFDVRMPDGSDRLVSVATVIACIPDAVERAELQALRSGGLIPSHVAPYREPTMRAELWSLLLGFPVNV